MKIQLANILRLAERAEATGKPGAKCVECGFNWQQYRHQYGCERPEEQFTNALDPGTVAALVEDNLRMAEAIEARLPKHEHTATHDFDCPLKIHPKLREDGATCVCEPELRAALEKHRQKFE